MLAVEETDERAVRHCRGHIAQLNEAVQPQLTDPREVVLGERGMHGHVRQNRKSSIQEPVEDGHRDRRGVRSQISVELRADAGKRLVHLDRRAPAAPFVEHIDRERRQTILAGRIARRTALDQENAGDERHRRVPDGPHAEPVRQHRFFDRRELKQRRAGRRRQPRAIHFDAGDVHDTSARIDPDTASSVRPRGTTLSVTRGAPVRYV